MTIRRPFWTRALRVVIVTGSQRRRLARGERHFIVNAPRGAIRELSMASAAADKINDLQKPGSPPFQTIALLLQGGGALGAYQAGVYEALAEANVLPNWIAGISIGAVNSALIAGNPPERRVARLREFWEAVSTSPLGVFGIPDNPSVKLDDNQAHRLLNQTRALGIALLGAPSFFAPRFPPLHLWPPQKPHTLSFYDVSPLKATLERLVDFDRINSGETRFSVGAVNVSSGNFTYFDTTTHKIDARHIIASGSLPPGFPATEVDGEYYWDGGLVSNTPLQWVVDTIPRRDTLAFQVDLWSASGELPHDLMQADVRQKEIQFASRTRFVTDHLRTAQKLRHAYREAYRQVRERLPAELGMIPEIELLNKEADETAYNVVELIYHARVYEGVAKDYEFSRRTMEEHWRSGHADAIRALAHPEIFRLPDNPERFRSFDFARGEIK
jgi:NTE family protein